jgi:nucleotide-binding universal stress UspA family protein
VEEQGNAARAILNTCQMSCELILMGAYEGGYVKEMFAGSTVDRVLRDTQRMVMICR